MIRRCQSNDRTAQSELYRRYAKAMLNCAYRILKDEEEARDVLQDAFVKVFRNLKQFRGDARLGAWIKRIVVNAAITRAKKKGLEFRMENPEMIPETPSSDEPPEEFELNLNLARRALEALPDGYRAVCTLYLVEGYDHQEIADILGISRSTSLSQYSRGKKKLRQMIEELRHGQDRTILQRSRS